jgi:hypothetical protein
MHFIITWITNPQTTKIDKVGIKLICYICLIPPPHPTDDYGNAIVDSCWMGMWTITHLLSPETTSDFRHVAEKIFFVEGDNICASVRIRIQ